MAIGSAVTLGLTQVSFGARLPDQSAKVLELIEKLRSRDVVPEEISDFICGLPIELDQLQPFLKGYRPIIEQELAQSPDAVDRIWFMYLDSEATQGKSLTLFIHSEPEPIARLLAYHLLVFSYEGRKGAKRDETELFETVRSCLFSPYGWMRWRALILWEKTGACLNTLEGRKLLDWILENDPDQNCQYVAKLISM